MAQLADHDRPHFVAPLTSNQGQQEGYLGMGMNLTAKVHAEIARDIFWRSGFGLSFVSGQDSVTIDKKRFDRDLTHFRFEANIGEIIYQF